MPADTQEPWLTTGDLALVFGFTDRRAASALARQLGGVKLRGQWRVPPDAIDRLRINAGARPDHSPRYGLPVPVRRVADPSTVPQSLGADWWNEDAT